MRYKALSSIKHNGDTFEPGSVIELTDAEAARLLENEAIEPFIKPFSKRFEKTALHSNNQEQ